MKRGRQEVNEQSCLPFLAVNFPFSLARRIAEFVDSRAECRTCHARVQRFCNHCSGGLHPRQEIPTSCAAQKTDFVVCAKCRTTCDGCQEMMQGTRPKEFLDTLRCECRVRLHKRCFRQGETWHANAQGNEFLCNHCIVDSFECGSCKSFCAYEAQGSFECEECMLEFCACTDSFFVQHRHLCESCAT